MAESKWEKPKSAAHVRDAKRYSPVALGSLYSRFKSPASQINDVSALSAHQRLSNELNLTSMRFEFIFRNRTKL